MEKEIKKYSVMSNSINPNPNELPYYQKLEQFFEDSKGNAVSKLKNFSLFVPRQDLTRFLVRYEIFKKNLNVMGSIVECGVLYGQGLMTFAQLSAIFEPLNYTRKIIGFDTYGGVPYIATDFDNKDFAKEEELDVESFDDLKKSIECFDDNRQLNHVPKVELVKGDICKTVPQYIKDNPHTVVSMLYIDCNLFEPTKVALEEFIPRMPKEQ